MFSNKEKMVRAANGLFFALIGATGVYIMTAYLFSLESPGLAADRPGFIQILFLTFLSISVGNVALIIFTQSTKFRSGRRQLNPVGWVFTIFSAGAVLAEGMTVYGLVLALFSGSIFYVVGFAVASWTVLWWVRTRFKQNLQRLP